MRLRGEENIDEGYINEIKNLLEERSNLIQTSHSLQRERKQISSTIQSMIKSSQNSLSSDPKKNDEGSDEDGGGNKSLDEMKEKASHLKLSSNQIKVSLDHINQTIHHKFSFIPNLLNSHVVEGRDEMDNEVVEEWWPNDHRLKGRVHEMVNDDEMVDGETENDKMVEGGDGMLKFERWFDSLSHDEIASSLHYKYQPSTTNSKSVNDDHEMVDDEREDQPSSQSHHNKNQKEVEDFHHLSFFDVPSSVKISGSGFSLLRLVEMRDGRW